MARYFKYKTPADLATDANSLGHDIRTTDDLSVLFEPATVGGRTVGNRFLIHPMEGCDGTLEGLPGELTLRRYQRFGSGGAKVIWGEATAVCDTGRMNPRQLCLTDQTASGLEQMLRVCRQAHREAIGSDDDLLVGLQLTHSGRYSFRRALPATHDPILDPFTIDKSTGKRLDDSSPLLSDDDLRRIEEQFVEAARLAHRIGYDFVDIKQCHRYLLSELLASKNRPGDYGGSFENRTRLARNVIRRIRAELPELLIASRFNAYDGIPYRGEGEDFIGRPCRHELPLATAFGTDLNNHLWDELTEPLRLARELVEWGCGLLSVSMGNPYANPHIVRPAEFPPVDGYHSPEHPLDGVARHFRITGQIQSAVGDVPVVGAGYSWLQDFAPHAAAANLADGNATFAGFGRATLSHPDFVQSLTEHGHLNRRKVCRTFSYCTGLMRAKHNEQGQFPTGCPPFDKEVYDPIWEEAKATRPAPETGDE